MIVISEDVWGPAFEGLSEEFPLTRLESGWQDRDSLKELLATATALVVRNRTQVDAELLHAAPNLKVVARAGVGLDNIDITTADERGVAVVAGLGANAVSVGELTVGLALSLLRSIPAHDVATRSGQWLRTPGRELNGCTWGLIGCGATGIATARLLAGFGVEIIGYDPVISPDNPVLRDNRIELTDLDSIYARSDVISIHAPATPSTRGMINVESIATMKPGVLLVSVGRGELIVEDDLLAALRSGHVGGAGLDVRTTEPPTPGALEQERNVVLTPHVAGITVESQRRINEILVDNIRLALNGKPLTHAVGAVR
jgi:D-3-phosphoglycerate dehydrogenase / 2-oxoglutarate reductase